MSIDTRLNYEDLLWLIAAADAWEEKESHEFYMAKEILSIPEFDEDHPAYDFIQALKRKFRGKEQQLSDKRDAVSEQAATMKARLYHLKRQLGEASLLDVEKGTIIKGNSVVPLTKSEQPKPSLKAKLAEAIRQEDYNLAAEIRDEIRKSEDSEG